MNAKQNTQEEGAAGKTLKSHLIAESHRRQFAGEDWQGLLDRIAQLDALIEPLTTERSALKQQLLESKSEIKPGDIITWNKGKRMARVLNIIPWVCGEPMWKVVNIRKDGTEGSICEVRPYDKPMRSNDLPEPSRQ